MFMPTSSNLQVFVILFHIVHPFDISVMFFLFPYFTLKLFRIFYIRVLICPYALSSVLLVFRFTFSFIFIINEEETRSVWKIFIFDRNTWHHIVTVQPSLPNTGLISLPIRWSFRWSDASTDDTIDSLTAHVGFFRSRQQSLVDEQMNETTQLRKQKIKVVAKKQNKTQLAKITIFSTKKCLEKMIRIFSNSGGNKL